MKDELTGFNLRTEYNEAIENAVQSQMGIVYFDVNNLKYTNDNMGHKYGDQLLKKCAEAIKSVFREDDVFRTGGDEFIAVLNGIGPSIIEKKLAQIDKTLKEQTSADEDGVIYQIASGYCIGDGRLSKQEIIDKAESRMYADKTKKKKESNLKTTRDFVGFQPKIMEAAYPEEVVKEINKAITKPAYDSVYLGLGFLLTAISIGCYLMFFG